MKREQIVAEARRYKEPKTPWRHRGRTATGLDCAGLVTIVCDAFGETYIDDTGYGRLPDGERFVEHFKAQFNLVDGPLKPGMIVLLRDGPLPCHCGFIARDQFGRLTLIHSSVMGRGVVEEVWDKHWQTAFRCALDFKGIED